MKCRACALLEPGEPPYCNDSRSPWFLCTLQRIRTEAKGCEWGEPVKKPPPPAPREQ